MIRAPRRVDGPLACHAAGLRPALLAAGLTPSATAVQYGVFRQLSGWLGQDQRAAIELTDDVAAEFVAARRAAGYRQVATLRGLAPSLSYLRELGAIPPTSIAPAPIRAGSRRAARTQVEGDGVVLPAFERYLTEQRRLAPLTVGTSVGIVRRFLTTLPAGEAAVTRLTVEDVHRFVLSEADRLSTGTTRVSLSALRSFLRYLFVTGTLPRDLSPTVPRIAGSRLATFPRALPPATVATLLASCDRRSPIGTRDFAILTLQARLGLRAHEVAAMRLEDLHWRAGEITVHGKGGRTERLPLPADVGDALVDYLRRGRPAAADVRTVFLRGRPPTEPISRNAVVFVCRRASRRAGIAVVGTHRLRHTAATEMLQAGASLREVGQVLRHRRDTTTAIYAKVDRTTLDPLARTWAEQPR